jgi:tetratricopeptide (TPR) repeat protein
MGDPARQADALNRGITFQIWRSIEAWINLSDGQALYLEGAEDFEIVGQGSAIGVQTKATAAPITLRSDSVVSLLVNFWRVRADNAAQRVFFRLVTTSSPTIEGQGPFTSEGGGLEIWRICAARGDLALAARLKTFLTTDTSIARRLDEKDMGARKAPVPNLLEFIKGATPEQVLNEVIRCVSFQTDSPDAEVVRESIATSLHAYGERMRLRPNECDPALARLFRVAAETAGKRQNRILNREKFRLEFEDAILRKFSPTEIAAIQSGRSPEPTSPLSAELGQAFNPALLVQEGIPDLPPPTLNRTALVEELVGHIQQVGVAVIGASSGMGKSTVAKLCARKLGGDWIWADLQGVPANNIPLVVRTLAIAFAKSPSGKNLALDNLNYQPGDLVGVENALAAIARSARLRGGLVIFTTQRELSVRLRQKMALAPADVTKVPRFNEDEIREFCLLLGCPTRDLASRHAKIVELQTSGHPRLVHARLAGLAFAGWPPMRGADVVQTAPEITEELDLARQLLGGATAGDKTLLYRLSITTGAFRRDHAVAIGNISPPLSFPADVFDRLVGPWIDRLGIGYFRLSPLLKEAAETNWSQDKIKAMRRDVAEAIAKCGKMTLHEANEILFQGLLAEDEQLVTNIVVSLATPKGDQVEALAAALPWLPLLGRLKGTKIFKGNPHLNFLLRILQFRVLMVQKPGEVESLCDIIDAESAELSPEMRPGSRFMWLTFAMIYFQARISPKRLLAYWAEARELAAKDSELKALATKVEDDSSLLPDMPETDYAGHWLMMIVSREMDSTALVAFADAVNGLPDETKRVAIGYLAKMPFPGRLAVERSWFREAEKPNPNWSLIVSNLQAFRERITTWNFPELAAFAARGWAAVEDEYRNDPATALAVLDEALKIPTSHNYLLLDQKALVLFRQKRFAEALTIWESILPTWPVAGKTSDHTGLYASQRAAHAAGTMDKWPEALVILRRGKHFAEVAEDALAVATFRADEGHAVWRNGDKAGGLHLVAESLAELERLEPRDHQVIQVHRARKCVEQVIKWFRFVAGATDAGDEWEPPAGFCSGLELAEKLKEIEACQYDLLWFFLADTEFRLGVGSVLFEKARARIPDSKLAAFRGLVSQLGVKRAFESDDYARLIEDVAGTYNSMLDSEAQAATGKRVVDLDAFGRRSGEDPVSLVEDSVTAAMIALATVGRPLDAYLKDWRVSARKLTKHGGTEEVLTGAEHVLAAPPSELARIFNSDRPRIERSIAALRIATDPNVPLEGVFSGHASLSHFIHKGSMRCELEARWGELVRAEWQRRVSFPTQFSTPRLTVPPIQIACADPSTGLKLVARILLAARHAVSFRLPESLVADWMKLAD